MLNFQENTSTLSGYGTNNHNQGGKYMRGRISTYQKCPKCGAKYPSSKGGFPIICKNGCQTQPTKYYVEYFWKGQRWRAYLHTLPESTALFAFKFGELAFWSLAEK